MSKTIPLDKLGTELNNVIKGWTADVIVMVEEAQDEAIVNARKDIKTMTPPKGSQKRPYINCYSIRRNVISEHSTTLYNTKYQLSHLLEDGHEVRNQLSDKPKNDGSGENYPHTWRIHTRTAANISNAKVDDEMHTTKFEMWENEGTPAAEDYIKRSLSKIKKLGGN